MLETCLENKIIYDFLILYDKSRWHKLIPSLIEIAILNLKSSFNTLIFSEEDIYNIIKDLKLKLEESFIYSMSPKERKGNKERDIFYKPSTEWRSPCGMSDYEICDNNRYCFSSKNSNKRRLKNVKSKIKEMVDNDKRNYYLNNSENNLSKSYNRKQRINYAISYDKNLEPEIIERTTIKKNKKKGNNAGKKIIQKMTQEEYEQKFREESQNANNELYDDENGERKIYIQRRNQTEVFGPEESKRLYNNYVYSNNKLDRKSPKVNIYNKNKKNLYHYKTLNKKQNNNINDIFIKNARQSYNKNNINYINNFINGNKEAIPKSQKHYENIEKQKEDRNRKLNNNNIQIDTNIKIENLSNDKDEKESDYDNNIYQFTANNNFGIINESDKNSFIGIEKKYEKKIDELERNILNNETKFTKNSNDNNKNNNTKEDDNKNNIENFSNKIKVDITNMEEYEMKRDKNKNANNDNINYNYNEDNQEQEYNDMNEEDDNNEDNNEDNIEDNNEEINVDENEDNEENENEENEEEENINNGEENESSEGENNEDGFLSQMSNMTEKTKLLFKKAMDEYPPLEEDTFYGQIQSKNN